MWGVFLAYIRRLFSSRLRFRVFWEAGRDNGDFEIWFWCNCTANYSS